MRRNRSLVLFKTLILFSILVITFCLRPTATFPQFQQSGNEGESAESEHSPAQKSGLNIPSSQVEKIRNLIRNLFTAEYVEEIYLEISGYMALSLDKDMQLMLQRELTERERERLRIFCLEKTREFMPYSIIEDLLLPVLAKHFSYEEIAKINQFYNTPVGKKLTTLTPVIMREAAAAGEEWGQNLANSEWADSFIKDLQIQFPQWFPSEKVSANPEKTLVWSDNPGWRERHLRRRFQNPLFPPSSRLVTQEEIDEAVLEDIFEAVDVEMKVSQFVVSISEMPKEMTFEETHEIQTKVDELLNACKLCGKGLDEQREVLGEMREVLIKEMRAAANLSPEGKAAYNKAESFYEKGREVYSNLLVLELQRIPKKDIVPTILSADIDDITVVLKTIQHEEGGLEVLRYAAQKKVSELEREGIHVPGIDEKLQIINHHLPSDSLLVP